MPVAADSLTDEELRRLRGKLTKAEVDALTDDEVKRLHAISNQAEAGLVGKPTLAESEKAKVSPVETPVVRQPQYPGQIPPLAREGPKDLKSFLASIGQAAGSGADRPEAPEPEYQPPTAGEAELNNPLLLGEKIRKEQDKLIGASQPMSAFAYPAPMAPEKADMLTKVAGQAAFEMVRGTTESIAQFVADPLTQAADHPVEFGVNLVAIAMPLAKAGMAGRAAIEAAGAETAAERLTAGVAATSSAGETTKLAALAGGAVGATAGAAANKEHPLLGAAIGGLLGAVGAGGAADLYATSKGMKANLAEMGANLDKVKANLGADLEEISLNTKPPAPPVDFLERRSWPEQRTIVTDTVKGWKGDGLGFDEAYNQAKALKEKGWITGAQESAFYREIGNQYSAVERPVAEAIGMSEALDEHGFHPVLSEVPSAEQIAREAIVAAPHEEVVAAQNLLEDQITQIDDLKTTNRQLGGDPEIQTQLRASEAALEATQTTITEARAGVEVPKFDPGEWVQNETGKPFRVVSINGKVATVIDESGKQSRIHVNSLELGDVPPIREGGGGGETPPPAVVPRQKGDKVLTPDGYTYTFHGEQPGAKGKPPIRYWVPDKPLPDVTNAKGVAVTDEAIRRNGLVHPDEMTVPEVSHLLPEPDLFAGDRYPVKKVLNREDIDKYHGLLKSGGKGFHEEKYPVTVNVRVTFSNDNVIEDSIKGLNEGHAMARAAGNWSSAVKIESLGVESSGEISSQTATAEGTIKLTDILSTTPLGGILLAGTQKDDALDPTPKQGSPLALKNALWAVPAGIFAYGAYRYFATPAFRQAINQFVRWDKSAPADLERVFETFILPMLPDKPATNLQRLAPGLAVAGGAAAGAFVGSKAGQDELSLAGGLLGGLAGAAMGSVGGEAFSKIFKTPLTYRQLYKMYFTEAAGMSPSAVQAKYFTRAALEGRIQEIKDVVAELDKFDDTTNGAIQAWMSGNGNIAQVPKEARPAAEAARLIFDNLTTDLLKSGLIKDKILRDTMTSNMGTYVPRMFLRYELDDKPVEIVNAWLRGQGKGWGYISSKNYLKARKDLPPAVLKALGEIVDNPGYLLARRGTVVAADIEQARYHRFLMASPENVIPPKFLRQQQKLSTFQRQMQHGAPNAAVTRRRITAAGGNLLATPDVRFFSGEHGFQAAEWQGRTYWKMPDNPKYGLIKNQFAEQAVASDIMSTHETTSGLQRLFDAPLSMFKYFKAVMNPASQFRNMITNTIFADIEAGIAPWNMKKWGQGLQDLTSKGGWYKRARDAGTFGGQFTVSEIEGLLLPHAQAASSMPDFIGRSLTANASKPAQFFTKWHQSSEAWARMTTFRHAVETLGLSETEAASFARRTIPDYQDVQRWVKVVRRSPFGAPFISFSYKAIPRSLEAAVAFGDPKKMMRFWKYPFAMAALNEYSAQTHGLLGKDEDTDLFGTLRRLTTRTLSLGTYNPNAYDTYRKYLPQHVGGMQIAVPWRDRFDRQQYLDGTFFLPWGDAGEMGKGDFARGTGQSWFPRQLEPSNPWFQLGVAGATGKDSFTGRDIIPTGAVGMEATAAWGQFLMRAWGPSLINPAGYGAESMQKSFSGDFAGDPNVKSRGTAVASELLGMRARPVDPSTAYRFRAFDFKDRLEKNLSEIRRLARGLSPSDPLNDATLKQMLEEHPSAALSRAIRRRFEIADEFSQKYPAAEIPPSPEKLVQAIQAYADKFKKKK